jgi:hypothetical protein
MTSMARHEHDPEAHRKAAEKITFEREVCLDLVNDYLVNVPEDRRPYVRLTLDHMMIQLSNLWRPNLKCEWKRDRRALLQLITRVFDRWAEARFERSLVLHQLAINPAYGPKKITNYLNKKKIGITELPKTAAQFDSQRNVDRKELSRGSRPFRVPKDKRIQKEQADLTYLSEKFAKRSPNL